MKLVLEVDLEAFNRFDSAKRVAKDLLTVLDAAPDAADFKAMMAKFPSEAFLTLTEIVDPSTRESGARLVVMQAPYDRQERAIEEGKRLGVESERLGRVYLSAKPK